MGLWVNCFGIRQKEVLVSEQKLSERYEDGRISKTKGEASLEKKEGGQ